jgi:formate hydrogenlyase transcriptional activator
VGETEARLRRFDGEYRWFLFRANPLRDESGSIVRWYGTNIDIEGRKRAEDALRMGERNSRLIVDSVPGLVCTMSASGELEQVNRQVLEYFGKTIEELKGWAMSDAVHPADLPGITAAWTRSLQTGERYDIEHRIRRADGEYLWFQTRGLPVRAADDRILCWHILLTDIDERKRAEAELRTIVDAIPQLIIAMGADGNFLYANQAVLEYTGLTKEEVGSERFREVFLQEGSDRLKDQREAAISQRSPFEYERRVRHKSGQCRWLLIQYNPLLDERGEVTRWYATGTDIHERKQVEERTQQENFALREQIDQIFMFEEIVGSSPALTTVLSSIVKVAPTPSTVLITGETGTGKELTARTIHKGSPRADRAFITVNCASLPSSHRFRIVRPREGSLHRRRAMSTRSFRIGERRYYLPRRNRRAAPRNSDCPSWSVARSEVRTGWGSAIHTGRRPCRCRHQP